jgi:hypothetical protein
MNEERRYALHERLETVLGATEANNPDGTPATHHVERPGSSARHRLNANCDGK